MEYLFFDMGYLFFDTELKALSAATGTPIGNIDNELIRHNVIVLQHAATHCNTLQHAATLQHCATHCSVRCNTLQLTATHCNTE